MNQRIVLHSARAFTIIAFVALAACGQHGTSSVVPATPLGNPGNSARGVGGSPDTFARALSVKHVTDMGEVAQTQNVHLIITLAHRNQAQLQQLITDQATPGSASYEHFLTPQQFDAQYGAAPQTRARIKRALRAGGLTVDRDRFGASIIEADASAKTVASYFSTNLHNVRQSDGSTAFMPTTVPVTPTALQTDVVSVVGLDTTYKPLIIKPDNLCAPPCNGGGPTPTPAPRPTPTPSYPITGPNQPITPPTGIGYYDDTAFSSSFGYAPYTYAHDYDMPVQHGFGGSAQFPVGILMDADVSDSDLAQFYSSMGVNRTGSLIREGSAYGNTTVGQREATLDVETISALAPASTIYLYRMPSLSWGDVVSEMNLVVRDNLVAVVSMSFGGCEKQPYPTYYEGASAEDSTAAQGSAQGITFVASSGDSGGPSYLSGCPSVMAPAASSYVTAIGGTSPYTNGGVPPNAYQMDPNGTGFQFAWGQSAPSNFDPPCAQNFCGTGGGASTHFQTNEQLNACNGPWRCVPDISFAADINYPGAYVFGGVGYPGASGTSFASPIFAAMQAEIDQRQATRKGNIVGRLYTLWRQDGYAAFAPGQPFIFHDITQGNSGYQATTGYDWASGIGSVDGWALSSTE